MRALARGDDVATGRPDDGQVGQLAADDGRHRLVKAEAAGGRITLGDVRQTLERQRADLEVHPVLGATDRVACHCVVARRRRIVIAEEGRLGLAIAQPPILAGRVQPFQQPFRALEPAVRDRGISSKRPVVPVQQQRDPRRRGPVPSLAIQPIRFFARLEHACTIVEPPARGPEPLESLGTACRLERRFERAVRLFPGASRERFTATLHERVWHQMECMTDGLVGFALPLPEGPDHRRVYG